tara:strand:+ start:507 stop:2612 length:2106 start_codon:yes stop_codon:yes gene_type:complete
MTNSSFQFNLDYEEAADYIPALEQGFQEEARAEQAAERMRRINDSQRIANAQQFDKAINSVGTFSKTLRSHLETRREVIDQGLRNKAKRLARRGGITLEGLTDYNNYYKDEAEFIDNVSYLHAIAAGLDEQGKHEDAEEIRKLGGYDIKVLKEVLALQAANRLGNNFLQAAPDLKVQDTDIEGNVREVTYGNAENTADLQLLFEHYLDTKGLSDVSAYDDKFLDKYFWPTVEKQQAALEGEFVKTKFAERTLERQNTNNERFLAAAGTDNFGAIFLEITKAEGNYYKNGRAGAREALIDTAIDAFKKGDITLSQLNSLPEFEFVPTGWENKPEGENTKKIGDYFKEFEGFDSKVSDAVLEVEQVHENKQKAEGLRFIRDQEQTLKDLGRPPTEDEVRQMRDAWSSDPTRAYNPTVKAFLDHLANNTLEDREDEDIIFHLEDDLRNNRGLDLIQINRISDTELRQAWMKNYESTVGKGEFYKQGLSFVKSSVNKRWFEQTGTNDEKSRRWKQTWINAQRYYKEAYATGIKIGLSAQEASDRAKEMTDAMVMGKQLDAVPNNTYANKFVEKVNTAYEAISKAQKEGGSSTAVYDLLQTTQFGDENDLQALELWNKTGKGHIPRIYGSIARQIGVEKWVVANWQYELATGKQLKKPKAIQELEKRDFVEQRLLIWRPTSNRIKKANLLNSKADFNSSELISHPQ